jgi:outer membrane protein insertion porin family
VKQIQGSAGYFSLTLLVCIVFPAIAPAEPATFENLPLVSIIYDPPAQPLSPSDLARVEILKIGTPYHAADAAALIDQLFATGRYRDVQIEASPAGSGVAIRVITSVNWFVGHIAVEGKISGPPSREELTDVTRLDLGTLFREQDVAAAEQNLHRLFERNGLYEHSIRVETDDQPEIQQRNVTFIVTMGHRAKYEMPVIGGDTKLPNETIVRATGWRIRFIGWWRQVTQERTRSGINGILKKYQKEDRLTAKATLLSSEYEPSTRRLKPTLDIEAGPKVSIQAVETKVSQRTLKRYVPVFQEQTLDRDLLVEGSRNLRDYFQSKGYFETQVDFRIKEQDPDRTLVEYEVVRGIRHKLVRLDITGNRYFSTDVIRERMFLQTSSFRLRYGRYSEDFVRKDVESITNLYKSNGFRDVNVTPMVQDDYQGVTGTVAVRIQIEEGPQYYVSSLSLEGVLSLDPDELLGQLGSTKGQPFSETTIAADQNAVLTEYYRQGFPDVSFRWRVNSSARPTQLDLVYSITEGPRQFVRDVITSGIHITRPRILNQNLRIAPGEPLSLVALSEAQRNLYQLGLFSKVDMAIQNQDGNTEHKHILYDFQESSRYNVAVGIGAEIARIGGTSSDLSTPAGATGFSPRFSADVSRLNLFGTGHSVSLRGRVSNLEQLASINYLAPRFNNVEGRNITFTALYDFSRDVRTFSSRREEASVQMSQRLSKPSNLLMRFAYRRVTTGDVAIPSLLVPQLLQPVRIGILSANYVQDRRDNSADAHRGIYNTVDAGLASRVFGSQRTFARALVRNATYHRLTPNVILARQTSFGVVLPFHITPGLDAGSYIPLPERFFGGGSVTHRGFPENQAGPRDLGTPAGPGATATSPTGFPLGGNAQLFNTVELRFPLLGENIGGVVFHDAGNIYRTIGSISFRARQRDLTDFNYMVHAVGFGIRYKTPLGPVRADLAYSINPPAYLGFKGTTQELLTCGPGNTAGVCQSVRNQISHFQFFFSIGQTF